MEQTNPVSESQGRRLPWRGRKRLSRPGSYFCSSPTSLQHSGGEEELPNGNEFPFDLLLGGPARTVLWVINRNENLTHYIAESKVSSSQPALRAAPAPASRDLCLDVGTVLQSQGISWCSQRVSWVLLAPEGSGIPHPKAGASTWNWENSVPRLRLALERHQELSGGKCSQAQRGTGGHPTASPLPELCPSALRSYGHGEDGGGELWGQ